MTEENQNFEIYAGNNVHVVVELKDEYGDPLNVSTASQQIDWVLKTRPSETSSIASKSTVSTSQITIVDGANGVIQINMIPSDSSGRRGHYYHEGRMTESGSADKITLFSGWIKIKDSAFD